ncbi:dihydrofolate reductase family protein [Frankia sp. AgB1.9]|uniref:RibD family protein n=1 Tax=unclassified Frankia TaxID=2632575 RepID=UPI0019340020|nr:MULTISPECIES: dihydrofolate reductase family protein [unclassified Frankia]MBL7494055.1 dihydrofolate reductase family protein [Frankia sp. AgW1.1]MBL7552537.1 dihydrofolate reductase family protein [Frankia sp. AgB1.9]MBL7624744.1 dihydrofolate reductase family protein [Frankia sp. AgB1.8]
MTRPYVVLSCATSIDGYIDDASATRLRLSNEADFDRVDEVRAGCDAILVGAGTIRADDPKLLIRSPARRQARMSRGLPSHPLKVTLTATGDLDPSARFFTADDPDGTDEAAKVVYTATGAAARARTRLGAVATVVDAGDPIDLSAVLADLTTRGVARLMVEGGGAVHTRFLTEDLADELQLVIAPFFVGDPRAPRFVGPGTFPHDPTHPARLAETTQLGEVVLLRYALSPRYPDS